LGNSATPREAAKSIESLKKRIEEHQKKLDEFVKAPTPPPGTNLAPEQLKRAAEARIRHLQSEIDAFTKKIEELKKVVDDQAQ
jgi:peptidoglycan hydrolase CwlO-like protein